MTAEDRAAHVEREAVALAVDYLTEAARGIQSDATDAAATLVNVGDLRRVLRVLAALPQTGDAAAVLADLDARCRRAEKTLHTLGSERPATLEAARLDSKRQGVALARSYIEEARAALTAGADQ